jgi:predicted ATPase/class 3 adenylate cyclase
MSSVPSGTVTFLFTDIEGSTRLAQNHPQRWEELRGRHHTILQSAVDGHNGYVFQVIGDAFCAAFHTAPDGLAASLDAQRALQLEEWGETPIRVRMGLHTGTAELVGRDYRGYLTMAKVQRIMSAAYGGQVLLSSSCAELVLPELPHGVTLRDMKEHRLKGLPATEHLWQVLAPDLRQDFPALQTLDDIPTNLPVQLTSFVGRRKELEDAKRLLRDTPLLTLIGPGGTGKTRLSIQAAIELQPDYSDGVWFVELAPILDPLLVPRTTALAIGLRDEPQRPVIDMLCDHLRGKNMLILLDNCEHLVEACAHMADRILHAAPHVHILASSREALGIAGEVTYRVPSLGLPDIDHLPSIESLSQYEAVKLFIDRAVSAIPTFTVTAENAPSLAQICHRLDGIPLAIELAAAKVRVLSVEQIARRLDDRFRLLTGGNRTALERHQTLRAAIDWSYNLLPAHEQTLFSRLSVFAGGWTLEAAESVCSDELVKPDDLLDLLEHLIHKSMVIAEENGHETRFRILETMRQYANEKLVEAKKGEAVRDKHLEYFLQLAETAYPHMIRAEQLEWQGRIDADYENLRAALTWAIGKSSAEQALRLAGALGFYWQMRDFLVEGAMWMDQVLSRNWDVTSSAQKAARAKVFYHRASIADQLDDLETMRTAARSALALCEAVGDAWGMAYSRVVVGRQLIRTGGAREPVELTRQGLDEFQKLGDPWGRAFALNHFLRALRNAGLREEYEKTRQSLLEVARSAGDRYLLAEVLVFEFGKRVVEKGQLEQALASYLEADNLLAEAGSSQYNLYRFYLAQLHFLRGDLENAKSEAGLTIEYCQRMGEKHTQAFTRMFLSLIAEKQGTLEDAIKNIQSYLELIRNAGRPWHLAQGYVMFGRLKHLENDREAALRYLREGIELIKTSGKESYDGIFSHIMIFSHLGGIFVQINPQLALRFLSFSQSLKVHSPDPIFHTYLFERFCREARANLSEAEAHSSWEAGSNMTTEQAIELAFEALEEL